MWIKVSDSLPKRPSPAGQCASYLVTNGKHVCIARYTSNGYWWDWSDVTHWMPLPQPPTEEK